MSTATLLLRLAGPTQCWDARRSRHLPERPRPFLRASMPTHSALVGLLGAALGRGRARGSDISDLAALTVSLRVDQPGRPRHEMHLGPWHLSRGTITAPVIEHVLDDAVILAAITGPRGLIDECAEAITRPVYTLSLGKREYPPMPPLLLGVRDGDGETALRAEPWRAARWWVERGPQSLGRRWVPVNGPTEEALTALLEDASQIWGDLPGAGDARAVVEAVRDLGWYAAD